MRLTKIISIAATAVLLTGAAAQAATLSWTEGKRAQVDGTTLVVPTDAANGFPGFDIGTLGLGGGNIDIHGRIVSKTDYYQFTSARAFRIHLLFGGYDLAAGEVNYPGDDNTVSGLTSRPYPNSGEFSPVNFYLDGAASVANTFFTDVVGGDPLIFGRMAAGTYTLTIDGGLDDPDALYDIRIQAVPLPAGGLLLLTALGGLGIARRRRK
jgi:hypothetical protein